MKPHARGPGAGRWQLAAQFFVEGLLVAIAGATGGVLAMALTPAIVAMAVEYLPRADQVSVDWTVLLFAVGAAAAASALSSLAPLWQRCGRRPTHSGKACVRPQARRAGASPAGWSWPRWHSRSACDSAPC